MLDLDDITNSIRKDLHSADIGVNAKDYIKYSIVACVFLSATVLALVSKVDIMLSLADALLAFSVLFFLFALIAKRVPGSLAKSRALEIESDLPIAIRTIGVQLNMHVPFEDALRNVAASNYRCSKEFRKVVKMVDGGSAIPDALRQMAGRIESSIVKKMVVQLIRAYGEGLSGIDLKRQADELIATQRFKFKEFSARISFLSLMFIALSCIAPTMFLAYGVISSLYLGTPMSLNDIWFVFILVFPILNLILIAYIKFNTPKLLTTSREPMFSKKEQHMLSIQLRSFGIRSDFIRFMQVLCSFSLAAAALSFLFNFSSGILFLLLPPAVYFLLVILIERRSAEIENYLPDALLYASTIEYGVPMERIIANISTSGYHSLSDEFTIASRQIHAGASVPQAFDDMRMRNSSMLLGRVLTMLNQCYKTGKDVHSAIRETADDIFELNLLAKEQSSSLSMQKYTILIGGCILVPVILAFVLNVISGIEAPYSSVTNEQSGFDRVSIITTASEAARAYLVIYVILASIFVAYQEGRARTFAGYAMVFIPIVLVIFTFVRENVKFV
ncbi:Type II secretion system (T2SS), protein F [uncultured archaeon]|nr:Type II secretion system (T2SS), protein F [uncultured archaeon]